MCPRPYRLGQRQATTDQTRSRILAAARDLLTVGEGFSGFSIDAVAHQADVARMTVYYQFGSKAGLLEALFDDVASSGGMGQIPDAFQRTEPLEALSAYVEILSRFYNSDRLILRRLRGLATLDPDLEQALRARGERRRKGLRVIIGRLMDRYGRPAPESFDEAVDILHMLTSFESFDALAGAARSREEVLPVLLKLTRTALGLRNLLSATSPTALG
jgi:AcrR family transcriptional regulator